MKYCFLILFFFSLSQVYSQDSPITTIPADSIPEETDSIKPHSIRTAVLLSAALPGAGQIYNHIAMPKGKKKAYWKVPLIYAGLGASGYFLVSNQLRQKALREEYTIRLDGGTGDPQWVGYDNPGILTLYNQHLNWRDLSILAVGAVYLLQVIDAGVEAHFVTFDVSEDLSFGFDPVLLNGESPGVRMTLNFR